MLFYRLLIALSMPVLFHCSAAHGEPDSSWPAAAVMIQSAKGVLYKASPSVELTAESSKPAGNEKDELQGWAIPGTVPGEEMRCVGVFLNSRTLLTLATCVGAENIDTFKRIGELANLLSPATKPVNLFTLPSYVHERLRSNYQGSESRGFALIVYPPDTASSAGITRFPAILSARSFDEKNLIVLTRSSADRKVESLKVTRLEGLETLPRVIIEGADQASLQTLMKGSPVVEPGGRLTGLLTQVEGDAGWFMVPVYSSEARAVFKPAILCEREPCAENFEGSGIFLTQLNRGIYETTDPRSCKHLNVQVSQTETQIQSVTVSGVGNALCEQYQETFADCEGYRCTDRKLCSTVQFDALGLTISAKGSSVSYHLKSTNSASPPPSPTKPGLAISDLNACSSVKMEAALGGEFCGEDNVRYFYFHGVSGYDEAVQRCSSLGTHLPLGHNSKSLRMVMGSTPVWFQNGSGSESKLTVCVCNLLGQK